MLKKPARGSHCSWLVLAKSSSWKSSNWVKCPQSQGRRARNGLLLQDSPFLLLMPSFISGICKRQPAACFVNKVLLGCSRVLSLACCPWLRGCFNPTAAKFSSSDRLYDVQSLTCFLPGSLQKLPYRCFTLWIDGWFWVVFPWKSWFASNLNAQFPKWAPPFPWHTFARWLTRTSGVVWDSGLLRMLSEWLVI